MDTKGTNSFFLLFKEHFNVNIDTQLSPSSTLLVLIKIINWSLFNDIFGPYPGKSSECPLQQLALRSFFSFC